MTLVGSLHRSRHRKLKAEVEAEGFGTLDGYHFLLEQCFRNGSPKVKDLHFLLVADIYGKAEICKAIEFLIDADDFHIVDIIWDCIRPPNGWNINNQFNMKRKFGERASPMKFCLLHHAIMHENPAILELLMRIPGVDYNLWNEEDCWKTPLVLAAQYNSVRVVDMILPYTDVNQRVSGGSTAIHHTSCSPPGVLERLLQEDDIDVNAQDDHGDTVLHARHLYSIENLEVLLADPRIDLFVKNNAGMTPLDTADEEPIVTMLTDAMFARKPQSCSETT